MKSSGGILTALSSSEGEVFGFVLNLAILLIGLFAVLQLCFVVVAFIVAKPVLDELAWPVVLTGNFLAAVGMACYLSLRRGK